MIFFRATKYLKYILLSRHRKGHGIHSPFVFDLVSRIFRNKIDPDIVCCIENIRKKNISDPRKIVVNDLGSGSKKMESGLRKVSDIAKYSPVPGKYGVLLSNMAAEFGSPIIVELGTSLGISTMYMAKSVTGAIVNTIEGSKAISEIAVENFKEAGLDNIRIFTGPFDEIMPDILSGNDKPGLVFIDGNHRKEPLISYFKQIEAAAGSKTVVIIDDIYYSGEMLDAWNEIKVRSKVSVTIDIFRMGIVFFRQGITRNNYIIRY